MDVFRHMEVVFQLRCKDNLKIREKLNVGLSLLLIYDTNDLNVQKFKGIHRWASLMTTILVV